MKSNRYFFRKYIVVYNYDTNEVEWVDQPTRSDKVENLKHYRETGEYYWWYDGKNNWVIIDSIKLKKENWEDEDKRKYYLTKWFDEIENDVREYLKNH